MILSVRDRDPRLQRMRSNQQPSQRVSEPVISLGGNPITKALPRIPRLNSSSNTATQYHGRNSSKSSKNSPSSRDRSKPANSFKSSRLNRKKSGSSDDSSPRKKSEEDKKIKVSSSRRAHSSKSPSKSSMAEFQDVDLRVLLLSDSPTTGQKSKNDKLLTDLMNVEGIKSSQELNASNENGKENNQIFAVRKGDLRLLFMALQAFSA